MCVIKQNYFTSTLSFEKSLLTLIHVRVGSKGPTFFERLISPKCKEGKILKNLYNLQNARLIIHSKVFLT
jgi:hypothetical protein